MTTATSAPHKTTANLGDSLKTRREELNLTLREAENATSIRFNYLQAIEANELHKIVSLVYAQGFIKQYAAYLGLDGEKLLREHQEMFLKSKPIQQDFAYGIGTLEMRDNPGARVKWLPNVLWIGAFAGMFGLAWYVATLLNLL